MKVILTEDIPTLGTIGSVVTVRNGYGRNYLLPKHFAVVANESNTKEIEHKKKVLAKRREKVLGEMKAICAKIEKANVTILKQVGEENRLFGTVTHSEVADELNKVAGTQISKKDIRFVEEIKVTGVFVAEIRLHSEILAKLNVTVAPIPS